MIKINHKIYSNEMIQNLKSHFDKENKFITYTKFVFLCGKAYSSKEYSQSNRGIIHKYLSSKSNNIFIVLSEKLWEDSFNSNIDLLTFEEFLAEISDSIILFVESPGSFCELGAFAYADKLFAKKLIIVVDEKYKDDKSFIITGPTAKAKKEGSQVVYAPIVKGGILSSDSLRTVIDEKVKELFSKNANINKRKPNIDASKISLSSFVVELLELIKIVQPISRKDLICLYKQIKEFDNFTFVKNDGSYFSNEIKLDYIYKLLEIVGLINIKNGMIYTDLYDKLQPLMFTYSKQEINRERNRLLCRKYKNEGIAT